MVNSQDDLIVDLDHVVFTLALVVLAVGAQLVLDHDTAPVHLADNLAILKQLSTEGAKVVPSETGRVSEREPETEICLLKS